MTKKNTAATYLILLLAFCIRRIKELVQCAEQQATQKWASDRYISVSGNDHVAALSTHVYLECLFDLLDLEPREPNYGLESNVNLAIHSTDTLQQRFALHWYCQYIKNNSINLD